MRARTLGLGLGILAGLSFAPEVATTSYRAGANPGSSAVPSRVPASVPSKGPSVPPEVKQPMKTSSLWPVPGERWIFRFERKVSAEYQNKIWLKLSLGGRTSVEPVGGFSDHRFFLFSYEIDRMQMQGEGAAVEKNEKRSFPQVRVEVDSAGKLREIRWVSQGALASAPSDEDADLVKDLTAQWLFFESRTRLGNAETIFSTSVDSPTLQTVSKRITRYDSRPEISHLDSSHEWSSDTKKVVRIEGTENFSIPAANGTFDQKTSYRWALLSTEVAPRMSASLSLGSTFAVSDRSPSPLAGQVPVLDYRSFTARWASVGVLAPHERLRFFGEVKKALDSGRSEFIPVILKSLAGRSSTSIEWRTGVGALAASSNPVAAQALLDLYVSGHRPSDEKLSILAAVTAGEGAPAPDWNKVIGEEVRTSSSDIRDASLFALGSAIRKEEDTNRRKELETMLWKEVKESNSEPAQLIVLDAIGNSGSPEYYGYVRERFASANPSIRAKAVAAVRFLALDLAQPILDSARADPSSVVRKAAEWSGKFRDPATETVSQAVSH